MNHTTRLAATAALALGAPAAAQAFAGGSAPEFAFDKVWNDGPATFADLRGKLVILDFAQTW
jgi:hypothetical protein